MSEPVAERSWRRRLLIVPPLIVAAAVLAFVLAGADPPAREPVREARYHVRVIAAERVKLVPRVRGFGTVRPAKVWSAVAQVGGQVVEVHPRFQKGAILDQGTVVIRLDDSDHVLAIAEAEANIRAAEAKLLELEVSERNLRDLLAIEARSLELKETQLRRIEDLRRRGTVAQAAVDEELRGALAQRKLVQDLRNALRLSPTQIAVQREQIAVQRAKRDTARLNLARTQIRLPFAARIAEVGIEVTQFAQAGSVLASADGIKTAEIEAQFAIAQLSRLARAFAPDADRQSFARQDIEHMARAIGLEAMVRLSGVGAAAVAWPGRVVRASDAIDPQTRTVGIIVAVDDSYAQAVPGRRPPLTKGMFVEVELRIPRAPAAIVVPRGALHGTTLYIVDAGGRLVAREVELGIVQGGIAAIAAGIAEGEQVVVSDLTPVLPGMRFETSVDAALAETLRAQAAGLDAEPGQNQ